MSTLNLVEEVNSGFYADASLYCIENQYDTNSKMLSKAPKPQAQKITKKTDSVAKRTIEDQNKIMQKTPFKGAALLIGVNYLNDPENQLSGCIGDVQKVKSVLKQHFQFEDSNIRVLTDDQTSKTNQPTKSSILRELKALASKAKNEKLTHIWVHYSGHGTSVDDSYFFGDEEDGKDEAICPSDFRTNGVITDDELKDTLAMALPKSVKATIIMDCCHSGTIMDLSHKYVISKQEADKNKLTFSQKVADFFGMKKNPEAKIVCLSGCKDDQVSYGVYNLEMQNEWRGAMTWSLLKTLQANNYSISFSNLLSNMQKLLKERNLSQTPQLTSSYALKGEEVFFA